MRTAMAFTLRSLTPLGIFCMVPLLSRCESTAQLDAHSEDDAGGEGGAQEGGSTGGDDGDSETETPTSPVEGEFPVAAVAGPAPTPPMGWNSWNKLGCGRISASRVREAADAMVDSGMREAGYQFINIDDCWSTEERTEEGLLATDSKKFPDGIRVVADYVHEKGLKIGIYSDRGNTTCARRMASRGNEVLDAKTFADWGIDYLKYDNCDYVSDDSNGHNLDEDLMRTEFGLMSEALKESGRDIVYSVCAWRFYEWAVPLGSLWRTTNDITDEWSSIGPIIEKNGVELAAYAGPNQWNDPDMLEVGNGGMTSEEYRTHFGMWAMMSAPLIAGNDLSQMDQETIDILTNKEVIAVDQDLLAVQGVRVKKEGTTSVWVKPLGEFGARAVALLNQGNDVQDISFTLRDANLTGSSAKVRDLWRKSSLDDMKSDFTARVAPHSMLMLKLVGHEPELPSGNVQLSAMDWVYAANANGPVEKNQANGSNAADDGDRISLDGTEYETGLGVAPGSLLMYRLGKKCDRFRADAGVDDQVGDSGSVAFQVIGDDKVLYQSDVVTGADAPLELNVDVTGIYRLKLRVTNGMDGNLKDIASWANARLRCED